MLGTILKALVYIGLGLLLLDFAPIHEGMTCTDPTNATTCPDVYFAQDYFRARQKFRDAVEARGLTVKPHVVARSNSTGLEYTMDVAEVPGAGKSKNDLIVHLSGTHGVEGFIGSAIQVALLSNASYWNATDRPTALFVHAVNPFGFAELRRFNENNVDLNRNFLTEAEWREALGRDANVAGYEDVRPAIVPEGIPTLMSRYSMLPNVVKLLVTKGYNTLKAALVTGQYHDHKGLYFGGRQPEPSNVILKKVLEPYKRFDRVLAFDVHSGLGKAGVDSLLVNNQEQADQIEKIFPGMADVPGSGVSSGYELMVGDCQGFLYDFFSNSKFHASVTQEFGTILSFFVARAVILENQAFWNARGTLIHDVTKNWLRDAFYPQEIATKKLVLKNGEGRFAAGFRYFAETA